MSAGLRQLLTRRRILKLGLGLGGATLALAAGSAAFVFVERAPASGRRVLSPSEAATVSAIAEALFPPGNGLGVSAADVDVAGAVDAQLASLLKNERRIVRAFLVAFESWPRASLKGAFSSLPLPDRIAMLRELETGSGTSRQVASLVRTIVGAPFFEDERVLAAIGHRWGCGAIAWP
jgi:hypothetical protein